MPFRALVLRESDRRVSAALETLETSFLRDLEVEVDVLYSTLNYKDGLTIKGLGKLVRDYPFIPGIDVLGRVTASRDERFSHGDLVISTGYRVGEIHFGGYAEKATLKGDWLVPLPEGLSARQAMAIGTAGFTAMQAIMSLEEHGVKPTDDSTVLVTGATGGVGSVAVSLLADLGYQVAASTGKAESHAYLKALGAHTIIDRSELAEPPKRPLDHQKWAGAIDNVGGTTLAHLLSEVAMHGAVASVGLAGGAELNTTVMPFLLRGVSLLGIDSNACPMARRKVAWSRLAKQLDLKKLDAMTETATLDDLPRLADEILAGRVQGRTVIEIGGE